MTYPTLEAALELGRLGFRVLPLKPGSKIPDLRHWPEEASSDPATIERHFSASLTRANAAEPIYTVRSGPSCQPNVGIATGGGLAVLDVDSKHGGEIPPWAPATLMARTPSGGFHLYYAVDLPVPNSVGRVAPGVDVRGERGQVAAPPSTIKIGGATLHDAQIDLRYEWVNSQPIAHIDADLLIPEDLKRGFEGVRRGFEFRDEVPVGERNNYLTAYAGWLYSQGEERPAVLRELLLEHDRLGFSAREGELAGIARSIERYHR